MTAKPKWMRKVYKPGTPEEIGFEWHFVGEEQKGKHTIMTACLLEYALEGEVIEVQFSLDDPDPEQSVCSECMDRMRVERDPYTLWIRTDGRKFLVRDRKGRHEGVDITDVNPRTVERADPDELWKRQKGRLKVHVIDAATSRMYGLLHKRK